MTTDLFTLPLPPRWLVFSAKTKREHMCVVAAASAKDAVRIARGIWRMDRTAFAVLERRR